MTIQIARPPWPENLDIAKEFLRAKEVAMKETGYSAGGFSGTFF